MILRSLLLAILIVPASAFAGVTIHFNGQLKDPATVNDVAEAACAVAASNAWSCTTVSSPDDPALDSITVESLRKLDEIGELSIANGVVIYPGDMSEPLYLVFGKNGKLDNFIKTQFAGTDTHIAVIGVFDAVQPFFEQLEIQDEGRYWATRSREKLDEDISSVASQIATIKLQNPNAIGPIKRPDGRILDLVSRER